MNQSDRDDDTWEEFFGESTELMPSIMGAFDAIIGTGKGEKSETSKSSTPKRSHQVGNFAHLSPYVQKILSQVPDQELNRRFSSEETLRPRRNRTAPAYRSLRSPEKPSNRSNEHLEIISANVQKMISNFPDAELVLKQEETGRSKMAFYRSTDEDLCECDKVTVEVTGDSVNTDYECHSPKPLGSYLQTSRGIASRTPAGRKQLGKYLQIPSESSVGTNSTTSSEVSRPVSLTSLGSCSSSGSSGPHQPGSAYLASVESLDSDHEPTGSQGSADSGIAEQPIMSPEARVLQEVLDTETVYVADLNEVIQGYLEPWKSDPNCPLSEYLLHLFNNLEEIYKFNKCFLDELRSTDCDPTKVAKAFVQNDEGFSVYNDYCTDYPRTMEVLTKLTSDDKMASLFREKQQALNHALPLGSYLLKPVQRILKYHLLLQRLSKQCETQHKPSVDLALTTMTSVACNINTMKRKHEHAVRVHEIQSQLYGWGGPDLTTLGELIAEGTFRVNGARGRRHVFLFDKLLLMAKNKQDGALAYKSHVECSNLMLVEQVRGEPLSFQILPFDNPRLQCTLRARSPQNKREWTLQIKRVILENYSAVIPNHARQLVMQLGQDVQDNDDGADKRSPMNKHSAPHYLERRSRVRKSRDLSGRRTASQDRAFPSLSGWRRKSEPSMDSIPQYNSKTVPKKIHKIKKAKEGGAKFYTDLSDSENHDAFDESNESLERTESINSSNKDDGSAEVDNSLEKIVSDLLMQNQELQKVMNRPRKSVRENDQEANVWCENNDRPTLPSKADSLPRSFQLNDQINEEEQQQKAEVKENGDEQHDNDASSHLDDGEYPEHKIYRKTAIRFSILQRIRSLLSEEEKGTCKYPLHKQGSKSMGEKIAHPDYVDPQKLFLNSSNSSVELTESCEIEPPERPDMSINETEVLNEFEKRLNGANFGFESERRVCAKNAINGSSHESDNFYESILEKDLVEEYTRDDSGKLVAKQDSFNSSFCEKKSAMKRPTKAPPPVPTKPRHLIGFVSTETIARTYDKSGGQHCRQVRSVSEKSWVKTMVGRFE